LQVFGAVNRNIDGSGPELVFQFLRKNALATDLRQRTIQNLVALGFDLIKFL
jgi:hypothetical protein